ncbi:reverse transcriptase (RNA-dependent DNA polymerase) domain-containing protein [Phthorimaea operculella]|nr:reverse transcriptase (RNA-dependent DNA polymerase) domain-containing protein [Phthorimaea operculella]
MTCCPSAIVNSLCNIIIHFYNIHFPVRKYPMKSTCKVWVSKAVKNTRNEIFKTKALLSNELSTTQTQHDILLSLENQYYNVLRNTRRDYIDRCIENSSNICRTSWQIIASETGRCNSNKNSAIDVLTSKSAGQTDVQRAASTAAALNRFYVDANKNCNSSTDIPTALDYLRKYVNKHPQLLQSEHISIQCVLNAVKSTKRKDSTDINDMSTQLLDILPDFIFEIICLLLNKCICKGVYPSNLKQIKVQPVYKGKGEMSMLKNFRPISLIPVLSKVFERILSNKLMSYLNRYNLMNEQQYAYQRGRSTVDAARDVITRVMAHIESRRQVAAIFCDLSRAFELVSHPLLLAKLDHYGVTGSFYNVIKSFLQNREQLTSVKGVRSNMSQLGDCAVPQGSIMGNNLFLLLMNDFTTSSADAEFVMFADDGCVIVAADTYNLLKVKLSKVMNEISLWFSANGMLLNVEKTNIIHFQLRCTKPNTLNIMCNNKIVPQVNQVRYLGMTIDSGLTWGPHIDALCDRLSSACFALSRLKPNLNESNLKKAYYGYFNSIMIHAVDLWGNAADRDRVFKLQKRAIRIISGVVWDHPAKELFIKQKILTLPSTYILEVAKHTRRNIEQLPARGDIHTYNTRGRLELCLPRTRLAKSRKCLHVMGPKLYNKISPDIKDAKTFSSFVNKLKKKLLSDAYYTIREFDR